MKTPSARGSTCAASGPTSVLGRVNPFWKNNMSQATHPRRGFNMEENMDAVYVDDIKTNDPVNHPSHYTTGKIECIDFITDKKLNFCRGNAVKYIVRAGLKDKDKEIEDLQKAVFYLNREIHDLEAAT